MIPTAGTGSIGCRSRKMKEEEFRAWLKQADANGDGFVSKQELCEALRLLGLHANWWKAKRGMAHADVNQNRHIDDNVEFKELLKYARSRWGIIVE